MCRRTLVARTLVASTIGLSAALAIAASAPATAQEGSAYREGLPAVLTPAEDGPPTTVSAAAFRDAYIRAGRPRVVVFWMRRLSDAVAAPVVTREERSGAAVVGMAASRSAAALVGGYAETRETTTGVLSDAPIDPLPREHSAAMEGGFADALVQAGVHLADRAAIIRLSADADADQKAAERAALRQRADVLVEVTASGTGAPGDLSYRLSAIRTADGALVASTVVPAHELEPAVTWKARGGGGFEAVLEPAALGRALAERLQARLAAAW